MIFADAVDGKGSGGLNWKKNQFLRSENFSRLKSCLGRCALPSGYRTLSHLQCDRGVPCQAVQSNGIFGNDRSVRIAYIWSAIVSPLKVDFRNEFEHKLQSSF